MKGKVLLLLVCLNVLLFSCHKKSSSPKSELLEIINELRTDKDHKFLKTLRPTEADIYKLFRDSLHAQRVIEYSNKTWDALDRAPANALKPVNDDDIAVAISVTQDKLVQWASTNLSSNYIVLCEFLNKNVVIYGLQYIDKKGVETKSRGAFFKVEGKWIFIPQTYMAFV